MKWVEMIRVRSSPGRLDEALPGLVQLLSELACESQLLRHGLYEGDLAALLIWPDGTPARSREGTLLAQRLGQHGAIDHAVWIPAHPSIED